MFGIVAFAKEKRLTFDNYKSRSIFNKHYRINLDLDDLNKARYPRMTQRATKRVPVLFMWCDRGQEAFVNVDLFQTTTNYSSFISLWLKMSFHRFFFSFKLTLSCLKST